MRKAKKTDATRQAQIKILEKLLAEHDKARSKINSQCTTLIQKSLVEKMINELK